MRLGLIFTGFLLVASTSVATAAEGPYLGVHGGISQFHDADVSTL